MLQILTDRYKTGFILVMLLLTLTSACSVETPAAIPVIPLERTSAPGTETPTLAPNLAESSPTREAASPTREAASPTREAASSTTPAAAPTNTAALVDGIDYANVEIAFGGFLSDWRYFITFEFPEAVSGDYHAVVDKNKPYTCEVLSDYPQRLYCSGPLVAIYDWASVELYASNGDSEAEPVLSGRFFVPLME